MYPLPRPKILILVIVILLSTQLISGCVSKSIPPATTTTPTIGVSPTTQSTIASVEPWVSATIRKPWVKKGENVDFYGTVQGGLILSYVNDLLPL